MSFLNYTYNSLLFNLGDGSILIILLDYSNVVKSLTGTFYDIKVSVLNFKVDLIVRFS
jgi:hypothetical protein